MDELTLSVVIPTYNRKDILEKSLEALFNQTLLKERYEILVVDDGSTDGTGDMARKLIPNSPVVLRCLCQKNKGPAAARNLGIFSAQGEIILFIGDDIIADENLLTEHLKDQEKYDESTAILGYVTWHPDLKPTPFMNFLEQGIQFNYPAIKDKSAVPFGSFFTANLSLKKEFLIKNGLFDEDFRYPAFDDIELAYRLRDKGMILRYNPQAKGYHYHPADLRSYCQRQQIAGRSAVLFQKKHPEQKKSIIPPKLNIKICKLAIKSFCAGLIIPLGEKIRNKWLLDKCYGVILTYYKLIGIKKGLAEDNG